MKLRDRVQELRELGLSAAAFRVTWELGRRLEGLVPGTDFGGRASAPPVDGAPPWSCNLRLGDPALVREAVAGLVTPEADVELLHRAREAARGTIVCFGASRIELGSPPDWFLNASTGKRFDPGVPGAVALDGPASVGDVKLTWEPARFPHAYVMSRAAALHPDEAPALAAALLQQIHGFCAQSVPFRGVHWSSGQEGVLRLLAWLFAYDTLMSRLPLRRDAAVAIAGALYHVGQHVERVIPYAQHAVYNNHLVCEALGLYAAGSLLPRVPEAERFRVLGRTILTEEATRQFDADGGYIQRSHNYHRAVLQLYVWACVLARSAGDRPPLAWLRAMERSLDFLVAQQNPGDGTLPNYGHNDGSLPSSASTCAHRDFRPALQCVSLLVRGERLYDPGPWDEEAAWFLGPWSLDAPLRRPTRRSVSFVQSGFHVLRSADPGSFATFRCGAVTERFGQIDMLHVDVWWNGMNLAIDPGTYLYNGTPEDNAHFMGSHVHNTVTVDGRDQMVHLRKFKYVHWTPADLLSFRPEAGVVTGEHHGFRRHRGGVVHRRSLAVLEPDLTVVADTVLGDGDHDVRLHWLLGPFPHEQVGPHVTRLTTPLGPYELGIFDGAARATPVTVVAGQASPLRGWSAPSYGVRVPALSVVAEARVRLPAVRISVLGRGPVALTTDNGRHTVRAGDCTRHFRLDDGDITPEPRA